MIHLGPYAFDHVVYDSDGDVLYMSIGDPRPAADSPPTPEGHVVRYDGRDEVIGVTIINARWLLERDGELSVTFPEHSVVADAGEVQAALAA